MATLIEIPVDAYLITLQAEVWSSATSPTARAGGDPFAIREGDLLIPSFWDAGLVRETVGGANGIWAQADITFRLRNVTALIERLPGDGQGVVNEAGFFFLASRYGRQQEVSVTFVYQVERSDLGGQAVERFNFCLLPWLGTARTRSEVLAHEFGHLLGLADLHPASGPNARSDASQRYNLMWGGLRADTRLTQPQVQQARGSTLARRFGGP